MVPAYLLHGWPFEPGDDANNVRLTTLCYAGLRNPAAFLHPLFRQSESPLTFHPFWPRALPGRIFRRHDQRFEFFGTLCRRVPRRVPGHCCLVRVNQTGYLILIADDGFFGACLGHEIIIGALAWLGLIWPGSAREEWAWSYASESETCLWSSIERRWKGTEDSSLDVNVMDCLVAVEWFPPRPRASDVIAI